MITKKYFQLKASSAQPGQKFMIRKAGSWERFKGWKGYWWGCYTFVSFDGNEVIFKSDLNTRMCLYLSYRQVKVGEVKVLWSSSDIFTINPPTDLEKENVMKLWDVGMLKFYK